MAQDSRRGTGPEDDPTGRDFKQRIQRLHFDADHLHIAAAASIFGIHGLSGAQVRGHYYSVPFEQAICLG